MNTSKTESLPPPGPAVLMVVLLAAPLGSGCGGTENSGSFEVEDIRDREGRVDDCLRAGFPLKPSFYAARDRRDSVGLFFQSLTRVGQDTDLVYIEVLASDRVRNNEGTALAFGYPPSDDTPVRAEIAVRETCPDVNVSLAVQGRVRFDSFQTKADGRMAGELLEGSVVDARTGETVAGSLTGTWDFTVDVTSPHRSYPTYDDEYPSSP